jgi:glutathione synthase/RimK-type ligase-like ATP-grasp enzyme
MSVLFVVNHLRHWPFDVPGASVVAARAYLTDPAYGENRSAKVFNLCKSDRYQGRGYYVSLLAEARGHQPLPDVETIEELQSENLTQRLTQDLQESLQRSFRPAASDIFELDVYFGRDPTERNGFIAQRLFALLRAPLLRLRLQQDAGKWRVAAVRALGAGDIPAQHRALLVKAAGEYVTGQKRPTREAHAARPSLAILYNADSPDPPSNAKALECLCQAAENLGMRAEIITRCDEQRLAEFDALFIRDTTNVNHYTYQFSRKAAAEGLVVIDDPESILRCTNKVYLNELMTRHQIAVPQTLMVHSDNVQEIVRLLGLPCILKQPDGAFSLGVAKVHSEAELVKKVRELFEKSELIIAQEYLPTEFDWRVGILDGRPLYVCKYFMAPGHWQVIKRERSQTLEGATSTLSVGEAPAQIIETAVKAANLIGNGLYGVDLKRVGDQCYIMEINDNPNIDAGNEDAVLGPALYREIMGVFLRRICERRQSFFA